MLALTAPASTTLIAFNIIPRFDFWVGFTNNLGPVYSENVEPASEAPSEKVDLYFPRLKDEGKGGNREVGDGSLLEEPLFPDIADWGLEVLLEEEEGCIGVEEE